MDQPTLSLIACPQCMAPAEVVGHFVLDSTDGPIEHSRLECVQRHWFVAPVAVLASSQSPPKRRALDFHEPPSVS